MENVVTAKFSIAFWFNERIYVLFNISTYTSRYLTHLSDMVMKRTFHTDEYLA